MVAILSMIFLGVLVWMLWSSFDAYVRADEALRRSKERELRRSQGQSEP